MSKKDGHTIIMSFASRIYVNNINFTGYIYKDRHMNKQSEEEKLNLLEHAMKIKLLNNLLGRISIYFLNNNII